MKILSAGLILIVFSFLLFGCHRESQTSSPIADQVNALTDAVVYGQSDTLDAYKGNQCLRRKDFDSALLFFRKGSASHARRHDSLLLARDYSYIGQTYYELNTWDKADLHFETARRIAERLKPLPVLLLAEIYLDLGACKNELHDYPSAQSALLKANRFLEDLPGNKLLEARSLMIAGSLSRQASQPVQSIEFYHKAIDILTELNKMDWLGNAYSGIGIVFTFEMHDYREGLVYFNKAAEVDTKVFGKESIEITLPYINKGFIYQQLGRYDSAEFYYKKILLIRRKIYGEKYIDTAGSKFSLAKLFEFQNKLDSAVVYYQGGLNSLVRNFDAPSILQNPKPDESEINAFLVDVLISKAETLKNLFKKEDNEISFLQASLQTYLLADSVLTVFRRYYMNDDTQLDLLKEIPYAQAMEVAAELTARTNERKYLEIAASLMEKSRATLVLDALTRAETYSIAGVPQSFRDRENDLLLKRAGLVKAIAGNKTSAGVVDSLRMALATVENAQHDLQSDLSAVSPNYFNIKFNLRQPSLDEIQSLLSADHAVALEYLFGKETIYILAITGNNERLLRIPVTEELTTALQSVQNELRFNSDSVSSLIRFNRYCEDAYLLYTKLVDEPVKAVLTAEVNRLVVLPDDKLSFLPFEALITEVPSREEVNYKLPYLLMKYTTRYAYSFSFLFKVREHGRKGGKLLAMGYAGGGDVGQDTRREGAGDLPGTEMEIRAIEDVMKNHTNKYYLEAEATESRFKKEASDFNLLHLAVHGEGDTLNGSESRLIFRKSGEDAEDGYLYSHELYNLNLDRLDLAVLSACETGLGKNYSRGRSIECSAGVCLRRLPIIGI